MVKLAIQAELLMDFDLCSESKQFDELSKASLHETNILSAIVSRICVILISQRINKDYLYLRENAVD